MSDRRKTYWYVELSDGYTNESAMEYLAKTCDATPDKTVTLKDRAGIPHALFAVNRAFINTLDKSRKYLRLHYIIYRRHERDTYVEIWDFPRRGKIKRTKKYREAENWAKNKAQK